ncbi:ABC transporter permease subunit [Microbacterium karelineae]|uniref:ABC transporter permease subunit n=1 Tax=Microbacterium karelineae TaxID=2654283 RepID=UPI0012EAD386|nr:ABC transporter permease subunit [Microbacterium karelineae]
MTTVTAPAPSPAARAAGPSPARVRFSTLLKAEWISLSSLRGTTVALVIGTALVLLPAIAMSLIFGFEYVDAGGGPAAQAMLPSATSLAMNGAMFAIAVATIVGAAAYAKEHSTGSLRTQLAASPRRAAMLAAKTVVVGASVFVASAIAFALALVVGAVIMSTFGISMTFGDPLLEIVLPILGGALFTACVAVFSIGVAAILRSETWAVTLALVFLFLVPTILMQLPWEWATQIGDVLLGTTGQTLTVVHAEITGELVADVLITIGWAAVAFFGGAAVATRKDA